MVEGLALPWGQQQQPTVEANNAPEMEEAILGDLRSGQRIEVQWQLSSEEGETHTKVLSMTRRIPPKKNLMTTEKDMSKVLVQWWGAELLAQSSTEDKALWRIRYDAHEGFDPEEAAVRFLSSDLLERQEECSPEESTLQWRRDGEVSDDEDNVVDLQELQNEQDQIEREMGQSLEQTAMEHLQENMAPDQQQTMLAGFRTFADHFRSQLQELVRNKGAAENYVVTESDVHNIVAGLKK